MSSMMTIANIVVGLLLVSSNNGSDLSASVAQTDQQDAREISRRQAEAFWKGGLRAAAAITGTYRSHMRPDPEKNAGTLAILVEWNPIIVVGRIQGNKAWLNASGEFITTDYSVFVERVLKVEKVRLGKNITVSVLGGSVRFSEGTTAEVLTPPMILPKEGERYVLFLGPTEWEPLPDQRNAAGDQIYSPSFMSLGLFQLRWDGTVAPKGPASHPLTVAYSGTPESDFVRAVVALVPREFRGPSAY